MTAGQNLVANSTLTTGTAWEHLINPSGTGGTGDIVYIKSFKVKLAVSPVRVYVKTNTYKLVMPTSTYKVVYKPNTIAIKREVVATIVKTKAVGCPADYLIISTDFRELT